MSYEKDTFKTMPEDFRNGDTTGGSLMGREKSSGVFWRDEQWE
jgi:hypothetical protein